MSFLKKLKKYLSKKRNLSIFLVYYYWKVFVMTMPKIDSELINQIRNKVDIVDVISSCNIKLETRGKNYFGVCPFHEDHSPSMSVSREKQIYTCFSCGATGNVFKFLQDFENISFI